MLRRMHELVYVLTVEAVVFGFLGTQLVAQRWNTLEWSPAESIPVLSSSLVLMFAYAQVLLVLSCALAVGKFGMASYGVMDACARSAGRVATVAMLSAGYVAALLLIVKASEPEVLNCFLTQLFGTNCSAANQVLWTYSVYLAVLLPVWALVGGLQLTASAMCKYPKRTSRCRVLSANSAFVLAYLVNSSLRTNVGCSPACAQVFANTTGGNATTAAPLKVTMVHTNLLFLTGSLCFSDFLAEFVMYRPTVNPLALLGVRANYSIRSPIIFSCLRIAQVLGVFLFIMFATEEPEFPSQLLYVHTSLAGVLCVFDIVEVVLEKASFTKKTPAPATNTQQQGPAEMAGQRLPAPQAKAFEVGERSRRKFMMTFTGRSRWPAVMNVPPQKKTT